MVFQPLLFIPQTLIGLSPHARLRAGFSSLSSVHGPIAQTYPGGLFKMQSPRFLRSLPSWNLPCIRSPEDSCPFGKTLLTGDGDRLVNRTDKIPCSHRVGVLMKRDTQQNK